MDILSLGPSLRTMPTEEMVAVIKQVRFNRRISKQPAKREAKESNKVARAATKKVNGYTPEQAQKLLALLESMVQKEK